MRIVASFDPANPPASQATSFNSGFVSGTGRMVVHNESNYNIQLSWGSFSTYCPAQTSMLYCVQANSPNINWSILSTLQIYNTPISQLTVEAYGNSETIVGTYPAPLHRQTATSLVGNTSTTFSATVGFGSTATLYQALNIYNPANSGVSYTFHAARVFTNDSTGPGANLIVLSGPDLNLGTPIAAVPHTGSGTPPVSTAHCTAEDATTAHGGTIIEVLNMSQSTTEDFLAFPDSYTLAPGNNLYIRLTSGTSAHVVRLTLKWSENTAIPSSTGGSTMSPLIAATLVNDGSPAGTGIVESTPAGGPQGVFLTNDGKLTLAGTLTASQLITALLGLAIQGTGVTSNGATSGTFTFFTPVWGTDLKIAIITFANYNNGAGTQTVNLPSSVGRGVWVAGWGTVGFVTFKNSGATVNVNPIITLAGTGGTDSSQANVSHDSVGWLSGTSNQISVTVNTATNGAFLFIGA